MKNLTILSILLYFNISVGQGMKFEEDSFLKCEKISIMRGTTLLKKSLEKYTPIPCKQIGHSCVALSFANARHTLLAIELKKTDLKSKTLLFSPYHFYYENMSATNVDCSYDLSIVEAAKYAVNTGFCPTTKVEYSKYYPFSSLKLCSKSQYPGDLTANKKTALKFRLDRTYTVKNIPEIKSALCNNMPIILAMAVPKSFKICSKKVWIPGSSDSLKNSFGHAVLCVGYDDEYLGGAVRIMNTWGQSWADSGYVWIKYKNLINWTYGGYAVQKIFGSRGIENNSSEIKIKLANYFSQDSSFYTQNMIEKLPNLNITKEKLNYSEEVNLNNESYGQQMKKSIDVFYRNIFFYTSDH